MGFFKKISSALGSLQDQKPEESSALDSIRKLKEELGMPQSRKDKDDDEEFDEIEDLDEDLDLNEVEEDEEEIEEEEEDEEDEELVENRQKPIFVVRIKRFDTPLNPLAVVECKDELDRYGVSCVLMRDKEEDPNQANCFFGAPVYDLMNKAITTLWSWNEDEDEPIEPVVDILVDAECYNDKIDRDTLNKVAYYIVNEFGKESWDIRGEFPYNDALIRVINEVDGRDNVYDFLAYGKFSGIDEDVEGWVERMISEHGIKL